MPMTRREMLLTTAAATGAAAVSAVTTASLAAPGQTAPPAAAGNAPEKPLRVAHLTDIHVMSARKADVGFATALKAAAALKPDFMITGGDHINDALGKTKEDALQQWEVYKKTLAANWTLPVYPVLGNHDIWAWAWGKDFPENDPLFGKAMALEKLGLKSAYYAFTVGAWRFIVLDSMTRRGVAWDHPAVLDAPQMKWLKGELANPEGKHLCVVSHVPIVTACAFFSQDDHRLKKDYWSVPDGWMHRDAIELVVAFQQAKVKLAIAGHIHLADRVDYNGVTYLCNGAVSADWWRKETYHETPAGFAIIDLYADGRFKHEYVDFGWKAPA